MHKLNEDVMMNDNLTIFRAFEEDSFFREYLENVPNGVCALDREGVFLYSNRRAEEIIGYTREELTGKNLAWANIIADNSRDLIGSLFKEVRCGVCRKPERVDIIHKDGYIVPVEISASLIRHGDGDVILGFISDITEKKVTELALLESRKMLHSFFDQGNDAILLISDYVFVDCNLKTLEMFGCTKDDIIGKSPVAFSTEYQYDGTSSLQKARHMLDMTGEGMPQFFEWRHCRKDGTPFDAEVSLSCLELASETYIQVVVRDVTERKRAQEDADRQREKLQTLSDSAPFGMVLIDAGGNFTYMNARFTKLLGYDLSDVPNGHSWFEKAYPDTAYRKRAIGMWLEDFNGPRSSGVLMPRSFVVTCKDGTTRTLNLRLSALSSGDFLMTCEDVTEVKRLESRLNQAQKMESLGTLAGGIVHDFNNILTVLMGYTSLIKAKIKNDVDLHTYVDQMFATSQKAANLTRQLLTFSRQQPVVFGSIDINDAIRSTEKILRKLLTEDIELRIMLTSNSSIVMADRSHVDQIFFNLITNARDAMKSGGTVTIKTKITVMDNRFIEKHGFGIPGPYVDIRFSDTGEGMDEATLERIFDPFFTTKVPGHGTGLGLATVYGIIKQHNGYITASSKPGRGTTFKIYLPTTKTRIDEKKDTIITAAKGREKILVAEDEEMVRDMVRKLLLQYGYTVIEAVNGQEAVEKYKLNPDTGLVILDLIMPKKNGRVAYEEIRRINPDVKVLFTSGYTEDVFIRKGIEESRVSFMAKPLSLNDFLHKVREILDQRSI